MSSPREQAAQFIRALEEPVRRAGALAREMYRRTYETSNKGHIDIVTEVDLACERLIIDGIQAAFPDHKIVSEGIGEIGRDGDWAWIVDPLDGTHNYVAGLPLFGMIVALFHRGEPVAGILHDAFQGDTAIGAAGAGVYLDGERLAPLDEPPPLQRATIGWTQGYAVVGDPLARAVRDCAEAQVKRLLCTWSPVIDTMRVLNGQFGAIVSFDGEITDLAAARALVPELGGAVHRFSRGGQDLRFIVGQRHIVEQLAAAIERIPGL
jgi:myo-inositol-1(or 4)-monophosphatase